MATHFNEERRRSFIIAEIRIQDPPSLNEKRLLHLKRRQRRQVARDMEVVVHINKCCDDPGLTGRLITCEITDFSGRGLHVISDTALVPKILLNIKISIRHPESSFELLGEIRWTKIIDNQCHMGIRFAEDKSTDIDAWVVIFG